MTRPTDSPMFDQRIADWLEDDPTEAPRQVMDTVLAAMPQISQRRSAPWTLPAKRFAWVLALVALAVLLLAVGVFVVGPSPGPTPATPDETTFTSPIYGYTVRYPANWTVVPGARQIPADVLPCALCEEPDNFWVVPDKVAITIAGNLPAGATLDTWTASVIGRIPAKFSFGSCPSSQESVTVGDEPGTLTTYDCQQPRDSTVLWISLVHGGAGWNLIWTDLPGVDLATIRRQFDAFLATFTFGTAALATSADSSARPPATTAPASAVPVGALPDEAIGAWYHTAPGWWWFLRAGDPFCVTSVRTNADCVVWQPVGKPAETAVATLADGVLSLAFRSGYCIGVTSTFVPSLSDDSLVLTERPGGCQGGNYNLTRAGTGAAPTAPPHPR